MLALGAGAAAIAADMEELGETVELVACREKFAALAVQARTLDQALINRELGGLPPVR